MESELLVFSDPTKQTWEARLTITDHDARSMNKEQLEMIEDGLWLIRAGLRGTHLKGPLSTPNLDLPIRT